MVVEGKVAEMGWDMVHIVLEEAATDVVREY
jgi:hypothetical protein